MLKIAFIIPYLTMLNRGIEKSGSNLAKAMGSCGNEISILYWSHFGERNIILDNEVKAISIKVPKFFSAWFSSWGYLFYFLVKKPDVVVIYFAGHGEAWPIRLARKFYKFHLSFIVGYPIETTPHRFKEFRVLGLEPLLDTIIVKSPSMVNGIEAFFKKPVQIISNGIDTDYFQKTTEMKAFDIRQKLGIHSDDIMLLTVAALEMRKGMQYVIASMERLQDRNVDNIYYTIIGEGNDLEYFEKKIKASHVKDKIHLLGTMRDVRPYYATSDLFLLLSYGEGFPNTLLEAWAMEIPVVVSDASPYPDITNRENAFMPSVEDRDGLDQLLTEFNQNRDEFRKIGKRNRVYLKSHYSWPIIASKYFDNFKKG